MPKAKTEKSWQERLNEGADDQPADQAAAPDPQDFMPSPELTDAMARALDAEKRARMMEVRAMLLERELHLAKARILELEIEKLKE